MSNFLTEFKNQNKKHLVFILIFLLSLILWLLFYPAYLNADGVVQYSQAITGVYEDWHPPVMAIILHYILLLGGGIATITFLQTFLGCTGIYLLGHELLRDKNVSKKKKTWLPFYILLILILPFSPLPFYLMAFLKDTWVSIGLIWIAYIGLKTTKNTDKNTSYRFNYMLLVLLMTLIFITRYNSIVLFPVFFILLFYNSKRLAPSYSVIPIILWSCLPLLLSVSIQKQFYTAFKIKKLYPENQVMAMESVGALIKDSTTEKYIPYIKSNLTLAYKDAYYPGNVASVMNWEGSKKTLDQQTFNIIDERIKKEYIDLIVHKPFVLVRVKMEGFYNMLKPSVYKYLYHDQLDPNQYGLVQNERFKSLRLGWQRLVSSIHTCRLTSFIGAEHIVWLFINILLLLHLVLKKQVRTILFFLLLIPLGYYFSYSLAATGNEFRFMYPATLLVQIIALNLLFSRENRSPITVQ